MSESFSSRRAVLVRCGNFVFRHRNWLFPVVLIGIFIVLQPQPGHPGQLTGVEIAGLLVACLGQLIRGAVVGLAYIVRGGVDKKVHANDLVTTGIFAHGRNPLYVGNLLILAGLFVIYHNPWAYLLGAVFFGVSYVAVVAAEEQYLLGRFGEAYTDYCRRVPRWGINPSGLGATFASMRFNWRRLLAKEYTSATSWIVLAGLLIAYKRWLAGGVWPADFLAPAAVVGAFFLASLVIKLLKKSGRLKAS